MSCDIFPLNLSNNDAKHEWMLPVIWPIKTSLKCDFLSFLPCFRFPSFLSSALPFFLSYLLVSYFLFLSFPPPFPFLSLFVMSFILSSPSSLLDSCPILLIIIVVVIVVVLGFVTVPERLHTFLLLSHGSQSHTPQTSGILINISSPL